MCVEISSVSFLRTENLKIYMVFLINLLSTKILTVIIISSGRTIRTKFIRGGKDGGICLFVCISSFIPCKVTSYWPNVRAILANIGARSWKYGLSAAMSVQNLPRANVSVVQLFIIWYLDQTCLFWIIRLFHSRLRGLRPLLWKQNTN